MRVPVLCLLLAAAIGLSGCQSLSGYPAPIESRKAALAHVQADTLPSAISTYDTANTEASRRKQRDRIVRARLYAIDVNYNAFSQSLSTEQKSFALGADIVTVGLTGAATLAKSAATKTRLATYASAALGVRATVDKEVYFSKTLPAIVAQMNAGRRTILAKITEGLALPDARYPLAAALADLESYYTAGTLNGALGEIAKEAGVQTQKADERIAAVVNIAASTDDWTDKLNAYRTPNGVRDPAHEAKLLACLPAGSGSRDVTAAINGPPDGRAKLAACLTDAGETLN